MSPVPPPKKNKPADATAATLHTAIEGTRRRMERRAGELLFELKPASLVRTQLGGHSRATKAEIGRHLTGRLRQHPVLFSGLVTTAASWLLNGRRSPARVVQAPRPALPRHRHTAAEPATTSSITRESTAMSASDDHRAPAPTDRQPLLDRRRRLPGSSSDLPADARSVAEERSTLAQIATNPVVLTAAAVGAGLVVGALFPQTRRGAKALARQAAADLKARGHDALDTVTEHLDADGAPLTDRAKAVAAAAAAGAKTAVTQAAVQAVSERVAGADPTPLGETAKRAAADAAAAAREAGLAASRDKGLHPEQLKEAARAAESAVISGGTAAPDATATTADAARPEAARI